MRMLFEIVYILHALLYSHANAVATNSSKLGPTIFDNPFNLDEDVKTLIPETEAPVPSAKVIIDILANRTFGQRMQIQDQYVESMGQDFLHTYRRMNPVRKGLYFDIRESLLTSANEILRKSIESSLNKPHDWGYMSILCTSAETRINTFNGYRYGDYYHQRYGYTLYKFIDHFLNQKKGKKFLHTLIDNKQKLRPESGVDLAKVKDQLTFLPHDKDGCKITNNNLLMLMTKESFDQIKAVDDEYRKQNNGATIVMAIDNNCDGDLREGYRRIVNYAVDPFGYYADEFNLGLMNPEASQINDALTIDIFTRCEIDLKDIDAAHQRKYNKTMLQLIEEQGYNNPGNPYRYMIYRIVKGNR